MDRADTPGRDDLSALAWVNGELRRSLEAANKSLRRYMKEAEAARGSDVDAVDPAVLRTARTHLHQGVGALELVGLPAVADVLRAAEAAVQRMIAKPAIVDAAAVATIERASFALLDFLARQLAGKAVSPLLLFPQYRAVQQLAGADRIHPADLWKIDWQWREMPADATATPRGADDAARGEMETLVLALMRQPAPGSAPTASPGPGPVEQMSDLLADLAAGARTSRLDGPHMVSCWQLAAAVFQAQAQGLLSADVHVKRLASRLLGQLRLRVRGQHEVSERLAQDLLFFCAQSRPPSPGHPAPRLAAVLRAWNLADGVPIDYESARLGRFDPALLTLARKRVAGAKDSWSAVAGDELHRLAGLGEQFSLVGESLQKLFPQGERLAEALQHAIDQTVASGHAPAPTLAMEVATAILYLDASLEDGDFDHPELADRVRRLAQRIDDVRVGAAPDPLDAWMEELYRRVSDRQTMGSVVQELRTSLSEIEKQIDLYFRDPSQRHLLIPVPAQLSSMRGVLSVLGLDQASAAVLHMRDDVDAMAQTEVDPHQAIQAGTFDRLADNLGALSFLIDMLSVQPALAKSLFRYDAETGSLSAVMGQSERVSAFAAFDEAPALPSDLGVLEAEPARAMAATAVETSQAGQPSAREDLTRPPVEGAPAPGPAAVQAAPAPIAKPAPTGATGLEDDAEMREVFIEEAREVVADAREALDRLAEAADHAGDMTALRRAFHTLKGSSRMVGLREFGEAAWACEQLYNARLVSAPRLDGPLRQFSTEALDYLGDWTDAIAAGSDRGHHAVPVVRAADALREGGARLPIELPATIAAAAAATAARAAPPKTAPPSSGLGFQLPPEEPEPEPASEQVDAPLELSFEPQASTALSANAQTAAPVAAADGPPDAELGLEFDFDLGLPDEVPAPADALTLRLPDLPSEADLEFPGAPLPSAPESMPALSFEFELDGSEETPASSGGPAAADGPHGPDGPDAAEVPAISGAPEALEAPVAPTAPVAPAPAQAPAMELPAQASAAVPEGETQEIDLAELGDMFGPSASDTVVLPPAPDVGAAPDADAPSVPLDFSLDLDLDLVADSGDSRAQPQPALEPQWPELAEAPEAPAPAESIAAAVPEPMPMLDPGSLPAQDDDEQIKLIGPLRINIPLFNIYLNEADELSRRLGIELAEWGHEHERHAVAESSIALAHSLAGSSATVGYAELSALARALEHGLMRSRSQGVGREGEPELFTAAADEIRRLLHQFAAGFLRAADAEVMDRLAAHERLPSSPSMVEESGGFLADMDGAPAAFAAEPEAASADAGRPAEVELDELPPVPVDGGAPAVVAAEGAQAEPSDLIDVIDLELFPIFEEEAEELLPQLHSRLRAWHAHPADLGGANGSMRTLHTLKGGARLAGAMRLGEMAHALETEIEALVARGHTLAAEVDPLLARADAMSLAFEQLRKRRAPAASPAAVPVPGGPPAQAPALPAAPVAAQATPAVDAEAPLASLAGLALPAEVPPAGEEKLSPVSPTIDWRRFRVEDSAAEQPAERAAASGAVVRVRAALLERMVNQAGEVSIVRARIDSEVKLLNGSLSELSESLERMRRQLRDIEVQAETQIGSRLEEARSAAREFDPLEMDRFTRFQELTRFMAESVNDVATLQRSLQRTLQSAEDELASQARLTRELQDDLLRTRMIEFESLSERLYRTARQAAKETDKQVRLEIVGGAIEIDRGVLERMAGPFEHLVRNCVVHGIEAPPARTLAGKDTTGTIVLTASQLGNEVAVEIADDGAGLDLPRIRERAIERGLLAADAPASDDELMQFIFASGLSTARTVTELAGRGVGMDVVRSEIAAMGGRIETRSLAGQGTKFRLLLPLTTAVTQIVMMRCGSLQVAVPSTLVEIVRRVPAAEVVRAYAEASFEYGGERMPFFWLGALLQAGPHGDIVGRAQTVVIVRSAAQRVAVHVDEVLGNQEVVVKNVGPQLVRMPGLAGVTLLPSGAVALIYNPVALASLYGASARDVPGALPAEHGPSATGAGDATALPALTAALPAPARAALVMVVDDSVTVRRVTQRLLVREGYRVVTAKDGLEALEKLVIERPSVVLSDIEMPRMDGFDLLRNLRADPALGRLPVIMITSRIAEKHREYATELGADHYLGKPYGEEELLALVARYAGADILA